MVFYNLKKLSTNLQNKKSAISTRSYGSFPSRVTQARNMVKHRGCLVERVKLRKSHRPNWGITSVRTCNAFEDPEEKNYYLSWGFTVLYYYFHSFHVKGFHSGNYHCISGISKWVYAPTCKSLDLSTLSELWTRGWITALVSFL